MPDIDLGLVIGPHFTPSVDREGNLSWTNDGGLENPAPVNIKGEPATINGVNSLTLEAGNNVTVTQNGDTLHISATDTVYDVATTTDDGLMSAADKTKLEGVASGAEVNVLEGISINGDAVPVANKTAALTMPTKVSDLTNDAGYQDAQQVEDVINMKVSSAYKAGGSATMATLPALTAATLGTVVNMAENFTTTADFLEGAGKTYPAGTNVVVAIAGENVYKYDVLAGFVDLSGKQDKLPVTGAANRGVYVSAEGVVSAMSHTLDKDVPADAALTDTVTEVDDTLSNSGQAADAKATGDAITALKSENALLRELINGIDAPIYREASGNPATFADGYAANVKALSVEITPTQSGSGDPYPPGGGKNLLENNLYTNGARTRNGVTYTPNNDGSIVLNGTITEDGIPIPNFADPSLTITNANTGTKHIPNGSYVVNGLADGLKIQILASNTSGTGDAVTIVSAIDNATFTIDDTYAYNWCRLNASGRAVFNNITIYPMIRRASDTGPTFAPYSNIRPISGATSVSVTRSGKNLFPQNSVTIAQTRNYTLKFPTPLPPGTYSFSASVTSTDTDAQTCLVLFSGPNGEIARFNISRNSRQAVTLTSASEIELVMLYASINYANSDGDTAVWSDIQFEAGAATDYEPYQGQTVSVALTDGSDPLTVYGGTLDVTTGELTVTHGTVDLGTLNWTYHNETGYYSSSIIDDAKPPIPNGQPIFCDIYTNYIGSFTSFLNTDATILAFSTNVSSRSILAVRDTRYTDATTLKTALSEHKIVYQLKTPVTYQLTPQQLATLSGYNAVSTDAGTLAVNYRADTALTLGGG